MSWKELVRKEWDNDGVISCPKCGRKFYLYFNGGELDQRYCCDNTIKMELQHIRVDLVISESQNAAHNDPQKEQNVQS